MAFTAGKSKPLFDVGSWLSCPLKSSHLRIICKKDKKKETFLFFLLKNLADLCRALTSNSFTFGINCNTNWESGLIAQHTCLTSKLLWLYRIFAARKHSQKNWGCFWSTSVAANALQISYVLTTYFFVCVLSPAVQVSHQLCTQVYKSPPLWNMHRLKRPGRVPWMSMVHRHPLYKTSSVFASFI